MANSTDYVVRFTGKDDLSKTIKPIKDELQSMGTASTNASDKIERQFNRIVNSTAPLKRQLRDLQTLMTKMNLDGMGNTEQYTRIASEAGRIKDAIGDASEAVQRFSSDTMMLQAGVQAMQGLAAAGSIATGVMGVLGVKNEEVANAILRVQSALAILNGVQTIANMLNKDSTLMLALKAVRTKLSTAATIENTVATGANTAAEGANTVAKVAETAATQAATRAQVALNVAVLANPYVLAGAAIAGLVAGIAIWISSMDDATDSELALEAATKAFDEAIGTQMKTAADQITTFNNLKRVYDENSTNVDILTKKIINNKEAQRKLGVVVKTVDDVHRLFSKNAENYVQSCISRANAMAIEAAQAALLGSVLSELSKVYTKMMRGEEVDWVDVRKEIEKIGVSAETATQIMKDAGGKQGWDWIYSNLEVDPSKLAEFGAKLNEGVMKAFHEQGAGKVLAEMLQNSLKDLDIETANFGDMLEENNKTLKETSSHASAVKHTTKETKEDVKKILTSLAGCDAIIQAAEQEMKNLDRSTQGADEKVKQLKAAILGASVAKLNLLDDSSLEDLKQAQSLVRNIIDKLPEGAESIEKWKERLNDITEKITKREIDLGFKVDPSTTARTKLKEELDKLTKEAAEIKVTPKFSSFDVAIGQAYIDTSKMEGLQQMMDFNDDLINQYEKIIERLQEWIAKSKEAGDTTSDAYIQATDALNTYQNAQSKIKENNVELGEKASEVDGKIKKRKELSEQFGYYSEMLQGTANAMNALGDSEAAEAAKFSINTASILTNAVSTIAAMNAEALAKGASSAFSLPFPANLAAWGVVLATITSIFASLPKFAEGGIVTGGPVQGDKVLARLNAGEMVLNKKQQKNMFDLFDKGVNTGAVNQTISWKIKGSDLYGTLRNYGKEQSKIGKNIGIG